MEAYPAESNSLGAPTFLFIFYWLEAVLCCAGLGTCWWWCLKTSDEIWRGGQGTHVFQQHWRLNFTKFDVPLWPLLHDTERGSWDFVSLKCLSFFVIFSGFTCLLVNWRSRWIVIAELCIEVVFEIVISTLSVTYIDTDYLIILTHHDGKGGMSMKKKIFSKHMQIDDSPIWGEKSEWARRVLVFIH